MARAKLKTLRHKVFSAAVRGGRLRRLTIGVAWPRAEAIITAPERLIVLLQAS